MTAMLPAHLTESVNNLGDAAAGLTEEIRSDREQRAAENAAVMERQRKQNQRIMALLIVVAVLTAGLVAISIANRRLGVANASLNRQNARIVERIESCTTVGGECYEQSQRRTGDVIGQIIRAGIYTHLCLRDHPDATDRQVEACVMKNLQASEPPPPAQPSPSPPSSPSGS